MPTNQLNGLIAAAYTPLSERGVVYLPGIAPLVEHLLACGVRGLYVCGSTGEGMSLTALERQAVAAEFVRQVDGRVPVIVHVGHNSLAEAAELASHAAASGATAISATCPSYYKIDSTQRLIESMQQVADAAPTIPFYYYHIPSLTGSAVDIVEFMRQAPSRIPNLAGLKYTDTQLHTYLECLTLGGGDLDIVWGCDEMLLGALATGAKAAIGSTYNVAAPLYRQLWDAFDRGDVDEARRLQTLSVGLVRIMNGYPFHAAMKAALGMLGVHVGSCRLPLGGLTESNKEMLQRQLTELGFFDWSRSYASGGVQ